jgi:hypothetical protein
MRIIAVKSETSKLYKIEHSAQRLKQTHLLSLVETQSRLCFIVTWYDVRADVQWRFVQK